MSERETPATVGLDGMVRPRAWLWKDINGDTQVNVWEAPQCECEPLYDQAAVEALVNQYADDERNQAELRWISRVDGMAQRLREMDARYMVLLKAVADGFATQPRTVVLDMGPNLCAQPIAEDGEAGCSNSAGARC